MKCENCGYPGIEYEVSRKDLWKGRSEYSKRGGSKPRTDFRVKACPKCGHKPKEVRGFEMETISEAEEE